MLLNMCIAVHHCTVPFPIHKGAILLSLCKITLIPTGIQVCLVQKLVISHYEWVILVISLVRDKAKDEGNN